MNTHVANASELRMWCCDVNSTNIQLPKFTLLNPRSSTIYDIYHLDHKRSMHSLFTALQMVVMKSAGRSTQRMYHRHHWRSSSKRRGFRFLRSIDVMLLLQLAFGVVKQTKRTNDYVMWLESYNNGIGRIDIACGQIIIKPFQVYPQVKLLFYIYVSSTTTTNDRDLTLPYNVYLFFFARPACLPFV